MRKTILLGLMLAVPPVQTGVVQGTVICEGTSAPVSGVRVTVGGGATVVTDNAGHFVVKDAPAGSASVRARREGYFGPAINGDFPNSATASVVVKVSEPANVNITLVPAGSVSGSIFDSNGNPMHNSVVGILRVVYKQGARSVDVVNAKPSGNRGEYRLYPVPPGEYYVGVAPPTGAQVTTLYPNTTNLYAASRIVVKAAAEISGIDIQAQAAKSIISSPLD